MRLLIDRILCRFSIHIMDWENSDGVKHCYCYKRSSWNKEGIEYTLKQHKWHKVEFKDPREAKDV